MKNISHKETIGAKADAFALLAACYAQPDAELAGKIEWLCEQNPYSDEISLPKTTQLKNCYYRSDPEELRLDHARLFLGPFVLAAPPFGSVYLENKHTLMGESTIEARDIYKKGGLEISDNFNSPPDHIIAELEFAAYLLTAEQQAGEAETADSYRNMRRYFLRNHLGAWIEPFAAKVEQGAVTEFYRILAGLTVKTVHAELKELGTTATLF